MKPTFSQEYLRSIINYDPATGYFTWKVAHPGPAQQKEHAGNLTKFGYVRITIGNRRYMAHLLAWCWMTGEWLTRGVDHRDTNRSNNAWSNLRRATQSQQNMNANLRSDNQARVKGVYRRKSGKFAAQVGQPGKRRSRWLGVFDTAEEAHSAYARAASEAFGDFVRTA